MIFLTFAFHLFTNVYDNSAIDIMAKLKRNILNFGYGVNFNYEGMLSHSLDRFYVVSKFELLKVEDLKLTAIDFNPTCSYWNGEGKYMPKLKRHCLRITPYIGFYQRQIMYYNLTAYRILTRDLGLVLSTYPTIKRPK